MSITLRPMTDADIPAASDVQVRAFDDLERRRGHEPEPWPDGMWERIATRYRHFLAHDPDGSWVATEDDRVVGCALALRRDSLWGLSLLVVDPGTQSTGAGRALLNAALRSAAGCDLGVILSSPDARAMRAYATSGFDLHPQVCGSGEVARPSLPALGQRVHDGSTGHSELANSIDRSVRRATRGPDHVRLATDYAMYVVDDVDGRGYAYVRDDREVYTLAATDEATAGDLLWRCLAHVADSGRVARVDCLSGGQQWAIRIALATRLAIDLTGPVFWRGQPPPACYLPSGAYL